MSEDDARAAVEAIVGTAYMDRLARFVARVTEESERQNLVAKPTLAAIWERHVLDSAQLLPLAGDQPGLWADVGTGAGFPGMIIALATDRPVGLIEPRRMRAEFLASTLADEGLSNRVTVYQAKVERVVALSAAVISARAVASLSELLQSTAHIASMDTLYLLPKGQSATTEVNEARRRFEGLFHVEQSITSPEAGIVSARHVRQRR
ncbi:16S rRNA (guanine527-N7)-methyltransferase [Sphingomonas sp. OV641]|uniref:16S rRNA (guanine(527)-N(7))-methyltransferase RsmG n=1 Tax=Sphingomonas sp. OV641 TaxID=1881068 RepID=UPI0008AE8DF8|nr:RsmG family class I SAM-dependent methyltransferase [Sphingomonas sp. OV641]SEJ65278.1 16S rRNA (guanine527-N7)-methyltransferase [Sphingomonas sp. OV641]